MIKPKSPQQEVKGWENQAFVNPSYDKSLPAEKRLYDFLGKYYVNLNGVVPNNNPEITEPHKKEIVDFVITHLLEADRKAIREKVEGMKKEQAKLMSFKEVRQAEIETYGTSEWDKNEGYNLALEDILNSL